MNHFPSAISWKSNGCPQGKLCLHKYAIYIYLLNFTSLILSRRSSTPCKEISSTRVLLRTIHISSPSQRSGVRRCLRSSSPSPLRSSSPSDPIHTPLACLGPTNSRFSICFLLYSDSQSSPWHSNFEHSVSSSERTLWLLFVQYQQFRAPTIKGTTPYNIPHVAIMHKLKEHLKLSFLILFHSIENVLLSLKIFNILLPPSHILRPLP